MKTLHQNITLPETTGTQTIAQATDVFYYIDSDFKAWGTDKKGTENKPLEVTVCELTENMTFAQMFPKIEEMTLTQEQIIEFCKTHKDKLQKDWYTFFLFKVGEEFFVADVYVDPGGLDVYVSRFSRDNVWVAENRHRIVLPQLALKHVDPVTLRNSDSVSLESAIQMVKDAGYRVMKEI